MTDVMTFLHFLPLSIPMNLGGPGPTRIVSDPITLGVLLTLRLIPTGAVEKQLWAQRKTTYSNGRSTL